MKRLIRFAWLAALVAAFVVVAPAADLEGYLIDSMCSMKAVKEGQKAAAMHTRDCALMGPCVDSGFGVITADNKFIKFDKAGSEKAEAALNASTKKDNIRVRVSGDVKGDEMKVASLKIL